MFSLPEKLYDAVSEQHPAGPSLRLDKKYVEVKEKTRIKTIPSRDGTAPPETTYPEWASLRASLIDLAGKTKDIELVCFIILSEVAAQGITGLANATSYALSTLETYWDDIHPTENDSEDRINLTIALAKLDERENLPRLLRSTVLGSTQLLGELTFRSLQIAHGKQQADEGEFALTEKDLNEIIQNDPASRDCLETALMGINQSLENFSAIRTFISTKTDFPVSFETAETILTEASDLLAQYSETDSGTTDALVEDDLKDEEEIGTTNNSVPRIKSVEEADRAIHAIISFYQDNNRTSPVPFIMAKIYRLLGKDFFSVIKDISFGDIECAALKFSPSDLSEYLSDITHMHAPMAEQTEPDFSHTNMESGPRPPQCEEITELNTSQLIGKPVEITTPTRSNEIKVLLKSLTAFFDEQEQSSPISEIIPKVVPLVSARYADVIEQIHVQNGQTYLLLSKLSKDSYSSDAIENEQD